MCKPEYSIDTMLAHINKLRESEECPEISQYIDQTLAEIQAYCTDTKPNRDGLDDDISVVQIAEEGVQNTTIINS